MSTGDDVTQILNQLRGLLGEGAPVTAPLPSTIPDDIQQRLNALPNGLGPVIDSLVASRKSQADISAELAKIDPSLGPVVAESANNVQNGRDDIEYAQMGYQDRRSQLAPVEGTPAGQMAVLQTKANAVGQGADAIRAQTPPAELRRALVEALAQKYYQQARQAGGGMGMPAGQSGGGGAQGGMPGGGMPGGGMPGGGGGGSPLSAVSGPLGALGSVGSSLGAGAGGQRAPGTSAPMLPPGAKGSEAGRRAAEKALTALGTRYAWGGGTPQGPSRGTGQDANVVGFDCSSLVQWAVANTSGEVLPRVTYDQIKLGMRVNPADAQPGDLVFSNFSGNGPEHVQMAIGDGKVVQAPQSGDVVKISNMPSNVIVKRIL